MQFNPSDKQFFSFNEWVDGNERQVIVHVKGDIDDIDIKRVAHSTLTTIKDAQGPIRVTAKKEVDGTVRVYCRFKKDGSWHKKTITLSSEEGIGHLKKIEVTSKKIAAISPEKIRETLQHGVLKTILSPFMALLRWITGKSKATQLFLDEAHCRNFSGFASLLKTAETVAGKENLSHAAHFATRVLALQSKKCSIKSLCDEISTVLQRDKKVAVPLGSFNSAKEFCPLLERNEE